MSLSSTTDGRITSPPCDCQHWPVRLRRRVQRLRLWWEDRHLPLRFYDGPPLRLALVGPPNNLSHLLKAIYGRIPAVPPAAAWLTPAQLERRATELLAQAELVCLTAAPGSVPAPLAARWIEIPNLVEQYLPLPAHLDELDAHVRNSRTVAELNKLVEFDLQSTTSDDPARWREFYHRFYAPYVRQRHGEYAWVTPEAEFMAQRQGGAELLLVLRGGQPIAGGVNKRCGTTYRLLALGVRDADLGLLQQGALGAHYFFSMQQAIRQGCGCLSLGRSVPLLNDGILFFKKKWGSHLRPDDEPARRILLASGHAGAAARATAGLLRTTPLAIRVSPPSTGNTGEPPTLEGLVVLDADWQPEGGGKVSEKALRSWLSRLAYDGLARLNVALVGPMRDYRPVLSRFTLPCPLHLFDWDPATTPLQDALHGHAFSESPAPHHSGPGAIEPTAVHF